MLAPILLILFLGSTLIQIITWALIFPESIRKKSSPYFTKRPDRSVSIIICTRDDWSNVRENLPQILSQKYPDFEVILVDDSSGQEAPEYVQNWFSKWNNLTICKNANAPGKKGALKTGFHLAGNEIMLLTDSDCCPASQDWIRWMASAFQDGKSIVIGYSPYTKESSWLNAFIRFESVINMFHYTSLCILGFPYMGVGRNLAYERHILASGVLEENKDLLYGDDDLVVNLLANSRNSTIVLHPDSYMNTRAKNSLTGFLQQKRRHISTSWRYKPTDKILLSLFAASMWLHIVLLLPLLLAGYIILPMLLYLIRFSFSFRMMKQFLSGSEHVDLLPKLLFLEIFLALYYPVIAFLLVKKRSEHW